MSRSLAATRVTTSAGGGEAPPSGSAQDGPWPLHQLKPRMVSFGATGNQNHIVRRALGLMRPPMLMLIALCGTTYPVR